MKYSGFRITSAPSLRISDVAVTPTQVVAAVDVWIRDVQKDLTVMANAIRELQTEVDKLKK